MQQGNYPEVSNSKGPFCTSRGYDTQTPPFGETYGPACDRHTSRHLSMGEVKVGIFPNIFGEKVPTSTWL